MESSSSAIVDFGRFCTGFLVVMGVGMGSPSMSSWLSAYSSTFSPSRPFCALWPNRGASNDYVHTWRASDLRDYHKLYNVFSGRARFLKGVRAFLGVGRRLGSLFHAKLLGVLSRSLDEGSVLLGLFKTMSLTTHLFPKILSLRWMSSKWVDSWKNGRTYRHMDVNQGHSYSLTSA